MTKNTVWLIGASSGLGLATANAFYAAGWKVIAAARSYDNNLDNPNYCKLKIDVCSEESILRFIDKAKTISSTIDTLVYCAGTLTFGPCELMSKDEYQSVISTNFLGLCSTLSKVLPFLRQQKTTKIFIFSSINGVVATPFQSAYVASKHAIEGYAKCLRLETKNTGIKICLIRPGDHRSGSMRYRKYCKEEVASSVYQSDFEKATNKVLHDEETGSSPTVLGNRIVRLAESKNLPAVIAIANPLEKLAVTLSKFLPQKLFDAILGKYYLG